MRARTFQSSLELSPECDRATTRPSWPSWRFQSSLELSPECDLSSWLERRFGHRFQSSLELSPECDLVGGFSVSGLAVSILTRAFARVQRRPAGALPAGSPGFNPHSSFRPSATREIGEGPRGVQVFQSSLELSPECNERPHHHPGGGPRFNPHSSFRPSATRRPQAPAPQGASFNPHSSFRPSATRTYLVDRLPRWRVSILTRAFARVQRGCRCATPQPAPPGFNPHSSFRPSATRLAVA